MTVAELIEALKSLPQDIPVCYSDASDGQQMGEVEFYVKDNGRGKEFEYLHIGSVGCDCVYYSD